MYDGINGPFALVRKFRDLLTMIGRPQVAAD
jgi:hypothetical protein